MFYSTRFTVPGNADSITEDQLDDMIDDEIKPHVISLGTGRWSTSITVEADSPIDTITYAWTAVAATAERQACPSTTRSASNSSPTKPSKSKKPKPLSLNSSA